HQLILAQHQQNIQAITLLKAAWLAEGNQVEAIITQSDVDKRSYSKRFLSKWLNDITAWAMQETVDYTVPECLPRFSHQVLLEKSKGGQIRQLPLFLQIEHFLQQPFQLQGLLFILAIKKVRHYIAQYKQEHLLCGFDDLLSELDKGLHNPA